MGEVERRFEGALGTLRGSRELLELLEATAGSAEVAGSSRCLGGLALGLLGELHRTNL